MREVPLELRAQDLLGGRLDVVSIDGMYYRPAANAPPCKTILLFMHPSGLTNPLALANALPKAGIPVLCGASRYPRNDSALIMEKVAFDMGAHVRYAKETLGFEKVILAGMTSHTTVEGTGRHAMETGYHVTFVKDAVADGWLDARRYESYCLLFEGNQGE